MLTDAEIKGLKPKAKRYRLADGDGLGLVICPEREGGGKYWQLRDRRDGKDKAYSLGVYPEAGLAAARRLRDEYKSKLAAGVDPREAPAKAPTFRDVAEDWFATRMLPVRSVGHTDTIRYRLNTFLYPALGERPIAEISSDEVLSLLKAIEARPARGRATTLADTAHRVCNIASQVFRYGVATERCQNDPTRALRGALKPTVRAHHAALTKREDIAELMRKISAYTGSLVVRSALLFSAYTFQRPGEIRHAEWGEFDMSAPDGPLWKILAEKMKMRRDHLVPLSRQAVEVIEGLRPLTGEGRYVFTSGYGKAECLSENAIRAVLRRMGYTNEQMTAHGFRSMASTNLNEMGWPPDVIERQLAHVEGNAVRAAYNFAEHLPERRRMMQALADWLDALRDGQESPTRGEDAKE
ncbi:MAG: tyrosine-type recombinase/integrase [Synergistaceae bacterium]|jgi:integrase|nr:tyrosine-type recombinase/integrase [Synergistaceae bacterium]